MRHDDLHEQQMSPRWEMPALTLILKLVAVMTGWLHQASVKLLSTLPVVSWTVTAVSVPTVISSLLELKTYQVRERGRLQNARRVFHRTLHFVHHLKTHSELQSIFKDWILVSHCLLTKLAWNDGYLINQLPPYSLPLFLCKPGTHWITVTHILLHVILYFMSFKKNNAKH